MKKILIITMLSIFLLGCGKKEETTPVPETTEEKEEKIMEADSSIAASDEEIEMLSVEASISERAAESVIIELHEQGISTITSVKLKDVFDYGYDFYVTDANEKTFYISCGSFGYIDVIKENDENGETIYYTID